MNVVHIRQSCPPPTSFIAPRTCRIRTKSWPSALCSNTRCMAPYCVSYLPTYTLLKYQSFKSCANSAFVKPNGWRINKDYSILFYSILSKHWGRCIWHNAKELRKMNMRIQKNTREFHRKSALMVSPNGFFQRKCITQNTTQKYSRCASPPVPKILINRNGSLTCTSLSWNLRLKNNKFWTVFYALYFLSFFSQVIGSESRRLSWNF
jgi:hypothetical protein